MRPTCYVACVLLAGACSAPAGTTSSVEELRASLPTRAMISIYPVATQPAAASACAAIRPSTFGTLTHQIAGTADGVLGGVLGTVQQITSSPPAAAQPGHAVWGPIASPTSASMYRLEVAAAAPSEFHFVLAGKDKSADESAWRGVFQGVTFAADPAHRTGQVVVDFGVMHALDASVDPLTGGVGVHFDVAGAARNVTASFAGITGKNAPQPDDAQYHLEQAADQSAGFAFITRVDFDGDGTLDEVARIDSRWAATGAGAAHLTVTGGSLGARTVNAMECWSPTLDRVFYTDDAAAPAHEGDPACCPN